MDRVINTGKRRLDTREIKAYSVVKEIVEEEDLNNKEFYEKFKKEFEEFLEPKGLKPKGIKFKFKYDSKLEREFLSQCGYSTYTYPGGGRCLGVVRYIKNSEKSNLYLILFYIKHILEVAHVLGRRGSTFSLTIESSFSRGILSSSWVAYLLMLRSMSRYGLWRTPG